MKRYNRIEGEESRQGSKAWHEFRMGKIGASMASSIMGVSPYETPLQLWERLIRGEELEETGAMKRGKELEAKARDWLNANGNRFEPAVVQRTDYPEIIASLDGYYEEDGEVRICEIKCPNKVDHQMAIQGEVPSHYYPQLQHQMDTLNIDSMLYASFDGENGVAFAVFRDPDYCSRLLASELAFLASLCDFTPPKPTDRDWAEMSDPMLKEKAARYAELVSKVNKLEEEAEAIKEYLISQAAHNRVKCGNLKMQKILRKGNIDYARFVKENGYEDLAEDYRKEPTESWRINI